MRILLLPLGSLGDVNPLVGLGLALQARGHEVFVLTNAHFEPAITRVGLGFAPCGSAEAYEEAINHAEMWDPKKGPVLFLRSCLLAMPEAFARIKRLYQPGNTVMAATPSAFAARIAQESLGIPLATLIPNPMLLRSVYGIPGSRFSRVPSWLRAWRNRLVFRLYDRRSDKIIAGAINSFRATLGLKPVRRVLGLWRNSPQRVIGLWPEWLYGPRPDWPPKAVVTGFIEYDGAAPLRTGAANAWDQAKDSFFSNRSPIVFTAGTANIHARDFFQAACGACEILNWPGMLLTQKLELLRNPLPPMVRHVSYAPLGELLPRAAVIVHHGGIGTAARALKAGIPQVIMPMAYDQHDNARRLARLGVARSIERKDFRPQNVAARLRELLQSSTVRERCRQYATKLKNSDALEKTCDYIEALGA